MLDGDRIKRLDAIAGVDRTTIENVVADIGVDLAVFPDEHQLSSWAGISPGNEQSAGKRLRNRTTRKNRWSRRALTEAAWAAGRTKNSYLGAQYRRLATRRGKTGLLVAVITLFSGWWSDCTAPVVSMVNGYLAAGDVDPAGICVLACVAGGARGRTGHAGGSRVADGAGVAGNPGRCPVGPMNAEAVAIAETARAGRTATRGPVGGQHASAGTSRADRAAVTARGRVVRESGADNRHRPGAHVQPPARGVAASAAVAAVAAAAAVATGAANGAVAASAAGRAGASVAANVAANQSGRETEVGRAGRAAASENELAAAAAAVPAQAALAACATGTARTAAGLVAVNGATDDGDRATAHIQAAAISGPADAASGTVAAMTAVASGGAAGVVAADAARAALAVGRIEPAAAACAAIAAGIAAASGPAAAPCAAKTACAAKSDIAAHGGRVQGDDSAIHEDAGALTGTSLAANAAGGPVAAGTVQSGGAALPPVAPLPP